MKVISPGARITLCPRDNYLLAYINIATQN